MAKYLVLEGEHREGLGEDLRVYKKGDVFDSPHEMDKLFRGKFRKVTSMVQAKKIDLEEDPDAVSQDTAEVEIKQKKGVEPARPSKPRAALDVPGDVPPADEEGDEEPNEAEDALEKKHGKDVTKEFQDAADNDLVVRRGKKGAVIMDGEKVLNPKPFKSKAEVNKFLKSHLSEEAEDGVSGKDDA